jgi:hypothetical protein
LLFGSVANLPAQRVSGPRGNLPFCPPQSCLYYAGDLDTRNPNTNALYNANSNSQGEGQVWVGVKPSADATVTGATFNECEVLNSGVGVNPTPFAVQAGIKPGHAGQTVCQTHGTATAKYYDTSDYCNQLSFTIAKLARSCHLKKNRIYFVNMLPTFTEDAAYLTDVEDKPAPNHYGWKTVWDDSYFNSATFGETYQPTWGQGQGCGGIGCDAFSIALTGTRR